MGLCIMQTWHCVPAGDPANQCQDVFEKKIVQYFFCIANFKKAQPQKKQRRRLCQTNNTIKIFYTRLDVYFIIAQFYPDLQ